MTAIPFAKMHGLGNDFIVVDGTRDNDRASCALAHARAWCDRRFGIGADGVILVLPGTTHPLRMRIINSDGSEAEMCGNGMRCFARYVVERGIIDADQFTVETLAGPITPTILRENGRVAAVRIDMGEPRLERADIPMIGPAGQVVEEAIDLGDLHLRLTAVSMGNPHAVIFVDDVEATPVAAWGSRLETLDRFPRRTNVEFVQVIARDYLKMRVWERGSGITLACGTGACATLVAGVLTGRADRTATVELPGGPLTITWDAATNHVFKTGPATEVFTGTVTG